MATMLEKKNFWDNIAHEWKILMAYLYLDGYTLSTFLYYFGGLKMSEGNGKRDVSMAENMNCRNVSRQISFLPPPKFH